MGHIPIDQIMLKCDHFSPPHHDHPTDDPSCLLTFCFLGGIVSSASTFFCTDFPTVRGVPNTRTVTPLEYTQKQKGEMARNFCVTMYEGGALNVGTWTS